MTTLKDTVEMRGDKDEQGGKQGTEERNESDEMFASVMGVYVFLK